MSSGEVIIFCDGASRGNPGPASFGVVAFRGKADVSLSSFKEDEAQAFFTGSETLGTKTNNEAEYRAIIFALNKCAELAVIHPTICSDSELVIKQLRGEYKVKDEKMKQLFAEASRLASRIKPLFTHVRREKNQVADFLANRALDQAKP